MTIHLVDELLIASAGARLGAALGALNLPAQARVGLCTGNHPIYFAARDALARAGLTAVPLHPRLAPGEATHILEDSGASALMIEPALDPGVCKQLPRVNLSGVSGSPSAEPDTLAGVGATLLYTSGTTGRPKGCIRTAAQEQARAEELIATYDLSPRDVHLVACPLAHSGPASFARAARRAGAATLIMERFSPEEFVGACDRLGATIAFVVPTIVHRLVTAHENRSITGELPALRALVVAGAPFAPPLKQRAMRWLGPNRLWEFYGSTETGTISVLRPEEQALHPTAVGQPVAGVRIALRDPDGKPVAPGSVGEIFVSSPTVMSGYLDGSERRDEDGGVSVGDLGYIESGFLHLVDRVEDVVISGGANIYPAEVERALIAHPAIAGAIAFSVPDDDLGETVGLVYALQAGAELSWNELERFARSELAGYKIPRRHALVELDELPLSPSGKPQRRHAAERFRTRLSSSERRRS